MEGSTRDLQSAVEAYIQQAGRGERLNGIHFGDDVHVLLPSFTESKDMLAKAADGTFTADGGTALYEAVSQGIDLLERAEGNRWIILMTDGNDSGGTIRHSRFWRMLDEKRIRIYTIGLGHVLLQYQPSFASSGSRFLGHMSLATNGRSFFALESE